MRFTAILSTCLLSVLLLAESCFLPHSLQVSVPQNIPAGYVVSKVDFDNCDTKSLRLTSSDGDFAVGSERTIVALAPVTVAHGGHTFSIWAEDASGQRSEMEVHLVHNTMQKRSLPKDGFLRRSKRRWSPPPFNVIENDVPPFPKELDRVVSDSEAVHNVYYTITGPGVDAHPVGLFSVDRNSGMLSVHRAIDREEFPEIVFEARVYDRHTNAQTDLPLPITVEIIDANDNKPTFTGPLQFTLLEQSKAGTVVGKVTATDRDKENTPHTKIRYSLLSGTDMFAISPQEGVITTKTSNLDREVKDKYLVTVQIKDMDGQANGLSNSATATITLGDINDNPPTFQKQSYNVDVEENTKESLILRIPVEDRDLVNTPNWYSQFVITKGNENGHFRIETDPKTNEGLLYVVKPFDYEKDKNLHLEIMARNQAELSDPKASWVSIPVEVSVKDVDEGPEFTAPSIRFIVKENTPNGTLIGSYTAVDPETKDGKGITYYKVSDPASWVNVDRNSGELRVANTIDRESQFVQDGIYNIIMNAVDASSKTGTGTVILQVEDANDNIPQLPTSELLLCEKEGELSSVLVVAEDKDQSPFAGPFSFEMAEEHDGKWTLERFNDTTARLEQTAELPTGIYKVPLVVKDLQGSGREQEVTVRVCQCRNGACFAKPSSISLGPLAILTMLLPLALLLLLCLLLAFFCVTKNEMRQFDNTGDMGGILLKSNTEAPGEEVDSNLIIGSMAGMEQEAGQGSVKGSLLNAEFMGNKSASTIGGFNMQENVLHQSSGVLQADVQNGYYSGMYGGGQFGTMQLGGGQFAHSSASFDHLQDSSVNQTWQTNGRYLQQKLAYLGAAEEGCYADDILHMYGFEGVGSVAGSVGCCSDQDNHDDLDFLNTLGPKFKALAHVCTNK
ncbi:desmocollin 2-like protein isoform X2 [Lampris incognitus]|uniref:desmocollin 2-like protein isoform X2 n=1 Tax=Lampris incognitus TaxID=2546036 RepID=UPI0024B48D21|nr:desmocollin 2-like protein isoform X2 [Lampris incognitus]